MASAIFLLVILAALGGYMLTFSATQHTASALDIQGARGYLAARAGIEWGAYQALKTGTPCAASTALPALAGDLAGFAVGVVDAPKAVDGHQVKKGHVLIGLASSGIHSNGYSLVRKVLLKDHKYKLEQKVPELGRTLGEELLTPTRIYTRTVLALLKDLPIHAMAHITGGGVENIPRVLPKGTRAVIDHGSWEWPAIFRLIGDLGRIERAEMYRTFNCGIGLVLAVPPKEADAVLSRLKGLGERAAVIGRVEEHKSDKDPRVTVA